MKHLGDITKISGSDIACVDCITFGSPCQDLSIAGKRAGLAGARSGLFMEAVRVIKEMREISGGIYPTFAIWENVPGAFSSNGGEDFRAVLEELARISQNGISIPRPKRGKWSKAGFICGNGWSIAWRTMDAQFWGVPQRRRRIALVMDFGGQRAGEILFERAGMSWYLESSISSWKGIARDPVHRTAGHDRVVEGARAYTLKICSGCEGKGNKMPLVNGKYAPEISRTLRASGYSLREEFDTYVIEKKCRRIVRRLTPTEWERLQGYPDRWTDIGEWLDSKGKRHKTADTPRYKALGNSIALPQWQWIICNMAKYLSQHATLGSLFDGIGGFPLVWETLHGKGTAVWASEIEEFSIAVTKYHFGEE